MFNGSLYFAANDGTHGTELWKTDGTSSGTALVSDIWPGSSGSGVGLLTNVNNNVLYFQANDGTHGTELWKTDGTSSGTVMVKDINPGSGSSTLHVVHRRRRRLVQRQEHALRRHEFRRQPRVVDHQRQRRHHQPLRRPAPQRHQDRR